MRVMFDTNVLLDVFQSRQPHYAASAGCVNKVLQGKLEGFVAHPDLAYFIFTFRGN